MIFIVLAFAIVVAVVAVVAAAGVGGVGGSRWGWSTAFIALAGGALLVVILGVVLVGRPSIGDGDGDSPTKAAIASSAPETSTVRPTRVVGPPARLDGVVELSADRSPLRPSPVVGGLTAGQVIEVRASGFLGGAEGVIAQCNGGAQCTNSFPVHTDRAGRATVQYRLAPENDATSSTELVMEVDSERATALVVDGRPPPGARLQVTDRGPSAGGTVGVRVEGARPTAFLQTLRCPLDAASLAECQRPNQRSIRASANGSAQFEIERRRRFERIVVLDGPSVIAEPLDLVGRSDPEVTLELDARRLLGGFAAALFLLTAAIILIRSTDWQPPAEAGTPFLDAASLDGP